MVRAELHAGVDILGLYSLLHQEDRFIDRQKKEIERQNREIEDLRRQKFHDDYYRSQYESGEVRVDELPSEDTFGGY